EALTPANVAEVGAESSFGRPSELELDDASSDEDGYLSCCCSSSKSSKGSKVSECGGPGTTAPNSLEDDGIHFFSDGISDITDRGGGSSLTSASRTSGDNDISTHIHTDVEITAAAAAAATASPRAPPPLQHQQQPAGATRLTGVRARARALERKIAGLDDDLPKPTIAGQEV
ncbi:unnamed protein product, partial [Laminaria digitata]